MKRILTAILGMAMIMPIIAQNDTLPAAGDSLEQAITQEVQASGENHEMSFDTPDKTRITVGKNEIFIVEDNGDTTRFKLGTKGMSVVEGKDGYTIDIVDMDEDKTTEKESTGDDKDDKKKDRPSKFKPHYAGVELGLNNFLNPDNTLHTGTFMNLNTEKSWNVNINFIEYGIGLGTSYAGLVTGLGLEYSNYVFDGNNSIMEENGAIVSRPEPFDGITKSKLSMNYLTAPLLLEFQIPAGKKRIHVSGGIIGGLKLSSKTKIKYLDGGRQKEVIKDDFSLAPFRYGATLRLGYRAVNLFATYYFSPLFGETDTPEIYPFSVGLNILSF